MEYVREINNHTHTRYTISLELGITCMPYVMMANFGTSSASKRKTVSPMEKYRDFHFILLVFEAIFVSIHFFSLIFSY